jgi:tetrahydromethanopterin S-methyltransferase subunit B
LAPSSPGYSTGMLYTILIILAIIALLMFILGRRRV